MLLPSLNSNSIRWTGHLLRIMAISDDGVLKTFLNVQRRRIGVVIYIFHLIIKDYFKRSKIGETRTY